jgi:hypothetical protein
MIVKKKFHLARKKYFCEEQHCATFADLLTARSAPLSNLASRPLVMCIFPLDAFLPRCASIIAVANLRGSMINGGFR